MMTFDAGERNTCLVRRQSTSTPLQALVLLNDPQFVEAARHIGERALKEGGATTADRVDFAFRLVTGRPPSARELDVLKKLYAEQKELFLANPKGAKDLAGVGQTASDPQLDRAELAASTALAGALLNLDDFVMKR